RINDPRLVNGVAGVIEDELEQPRRLHRGVDRGFGACRFLGPRRDAARGALAERRGTQLARDHIPFVTRQGLTSTFPNSACLSPNEHPNAAWVPRDCSTRHGKLRPLRQTVTAGVRLDNRNLPLGIAATRN